MAAIQTFGSYQIGGIPAAQIHRLHAALLAILIAAPKRPVSRSQIVELIWQPSKLSSPSHSLSQCLYGLRKVLPAGAILSNKQGLRIATGVVQTDYDEILRAISNGDDLAVVSLYRGRFLDDFTYVTDEFDDWRLATAASIHEEVAAARWRALATLESQERYDEAAYLAKTGLEIDALDPSLAKARVTYLALGREHTRAVQELSIYRNKHLREDGRVPEELGASLDATLKNAQLPSTKHDETAISIVGRSWERSQLARIPELLRERSAAMLLTGEPGIGKTRLVNHMLRRLALSGARTFLHCTTAGETHLPFSTAIGLLRDGFRSGDRAKLSATCLMGLHSAIPDLTRDNEQPTATDLSSAWDSIVQYFEVVCSNDPTVVCVDNLQWADESSRAILTHLSRRLADSRVIFVYVARTKNCVLPLFEDKYPDVLKLELSELTEPEVHEFVATYARRYGMQLAADTAEFLYNKIGGRPFFLLEALRVLRESPSGSHTEWYSQLISSPTLSTNVLQRLERSSTGAGLLAKAASLINRAVSLELLAAITGLTPMDAASAAEELMAIGMIRRRREIEFCHDLIREAVQHSVPPFEAALWHSRIAQQLLQVPRGTAEAAAHLENAGEMRLAHDYAKRAATEASSAKAYRLEEEQYLRMMRCSAGHSHREALYELARYWARTGQYQKLEPHISTLRGMLETYPAADVQLACAVALMETEERTGQSSAEALVGRARDIIERAACGGPEIVARVVWHVAEHFRRSKQYILMEEIAAALLREAENLGSAGQVEATAAAALLMASCSGYAAAVSPAERAVQLAEGLADDLLTSRAGFVRGTVRLWTGQLIVARQDYERSIEAADRAEAFWVLRAVRANLAVVLSEQADFEHAITMAQQSLIDGGYRHRAYAYGNLALINLRRGDYDGVRRYACALRDCHTASPESWIPPHVAGLLGLVDLANNKVDEAVKRANFVTANLSVAESVTDVSHLHVLRARAALAQGHRKYSDDLLAHAIVSLEPYDFIACTRLRLEQARLCSEIDSPAANVLERIAQDAESKGAFLLAKEAKSFADTCLR